MNTEEAQRIISGGEGQTTEFKRSFAEENEIIKSLCAFAHADGGTVFIGVGDDLQIVGVTLGNNTLENFANNVRRSTNPPLSPALYQLNIEGRVIVVAVAQQAEENQVFYAFTLPYIRVGKRNQVMSPDEQRARLSRSDLGSSSPSMTRSDANEYAERREHFIRLNDRISNLDSQRIKEGKEELLRSYLEATIPRRVARISQQSNPDSRFVIVGMWEMKRLEDFVDPSFYWLSYFGGLGRELAAGEQSYMHEAISRQIDPDVVTVSRSNPQFQQLEERIKGMVEEGLAPNVMLAPIEVYVPFTQHFVSKMNWAKGKPKELRIGGTTLNVFWSHKSAPLASFNLFSSSAGTWHLIPDQETRLGITIGVGQSGIYPDSIEIGTETTVRFEVNDIRAFSVIELGD